jgi:hypothetical protein
VWTTRHDTHPRMKIGLWLVYGLSMVYGLWPVAYGLWSMACGLWPMGRQFPNGVVADSLQPSGSEVKATPRRVESTPGLPQSMKPRANVESRPPRCVGRRLPRGQPPGRAGRYDGQGRVVNVRAGRVSERVAASGSRVRAVAASGSPAVDGARRPCATWVTEIRRECRKRDLRDSSLASARGCHASSGRPGTTVAARWLYGYPCS